MIKTLKQCCERKKTYPYFRRQIKQDKQWVPHKVCKTCVESLCNWINNKGDRKGFAVPVVWSEHKDHSNDCYFCLINVKGQIDSKDTNGNILAFCKTNITKNIAKNFLWFPFLRLKTIIILKYVCYVF